MKNSSQTKLVSWLREDRETKRQASSGSVGSLSGLIVTHLNPAADIMSFCLSFFSGSFFWSPGLAAKHQHRNDRSQVTGGTTIKQYLFRCSKKIEIHRIALPCFGLPPSLKVENLVVSLRILSSVFVQTVEVGKTCVCIWV